MTNYSQTPFTEIATFIRGVSYDKNVASVTAKDGYIPILRANNIQKELILNDLVYVPSDLIKEEQMIREGDIVLAMSSGSKDLVGKSAQANTDINAAFGIFCGLIRAKEGIDSKYLGLYFQTQEYRNFVSYQSKGVNICNLKKKDIETLQIPLPPLPTQRAIVARIEELFAELDKAVDKLKTARQQLKTYRQAVLKAAFEECEEQKPLGLIANSRLGKMLDKNKNEGIPRKYLRNANVRWFDFDLSDLQEMKITDDEIEKYSIIKGDLVICEGGEPGRCAVWTFDDPIFYQKALHRIRFSEKADSKFFMYYLWLLSMSGKLDKYFTGTGIKHLTGESLAKVPVPFCSFPEQQRIVAEIESRLSACESMEQSITQSLAQAEVLRQSILKKAFSGELV